MFWWKRALGFLLAILALIPLPGLIAADAKHVPSSNTSPPSEEAVDCFVKKEIPSHLSLRYFKTSELLKDGAELRLCRKLIVVPKENLYLDVTEEALIQVNVSGPIPADIQKPIILKLGARTHEILELPADVICRDQDGAWVPSQLEDRGQFEALGKPRSVFPLSAVVFGTPEARTALAAFSKKVSTPSQKSNAPKETVTPAIIDSGPNTVITATQLYNEYVQSTSDANAKFKNKPFHVQGMTERFAYAHSANSFSIEFRVPGTKLRVEATVELSAELAKHGIKINTGADTVEYAGRFHHKGDSLEISGYCEGLTGGKVFINHALIWKERR